MSARKTPQPRLPNGQFRAKDTIARTMFVMHVARAEILPGIDGFVATARNAPGAAKIIIDAEFADTHLLAAVIEKAVRSAIPKRQDVQEAEALAHNMLVAP